MDILFDLTTWVLFNLNTAITIFVVFVLLLFFLLFNKKKKNPDYAISNNGSLEQVETSNLVAPETKKTSSVVLEILILVFTTIVSVVNVIIFVIFSFSMMFFCDDPSNFCEALPLITMIQFGSIILAWSFYFTAKIIKNAMLIKLSLILSIPFAFIGWIIKIINY